MNKPIEPERSPHDDDLGALFRAQKVTVPHDMDDFILAEARLATSEPVKGSARSASSGLRGWVAAAAVAMIAVGIAPMLLQNPESELTFATEPQLDGVAPNIRAIASVSAESVRSVSAEAVSDHSAGEKAESTTAAIANEAAPVVAAKRSENTAISGGAAGDAEQDTPSDSASQDKPNAGIASFVKATIPARDLSAQTPDNVAEYRSKPESWIKEIERLEAENRITAARREYAQFRLQFPHFETPYRPQ